MFDNDIMVVIESVVETWGERTLKDMRTQFNTPIGFGIRKYNKLQTRTYINKVYWTPKIQRDLSNLLWLVTQPAWVDEGRPPGTNPDLNKIWEWAENRGLPKSGAKGRSRFVYNVREKVIDRGVQALDYSKMFEEKVRVDDLENKLYITIEKMIDKKLDSLVKNI